MNRRLSSPDHSLNAPLQQDGDGEWQDWLVDESDNQEDTLADREELDERRAAAGRGAMESLNERERHILDRAAPDGGPDDAGGAVARNTASAASACARSRSAPSRSCRRRSRNAATERRNAVAQ